MDSSPISRRAAAFHDLKSFTVVRDFIWHSPYTERYTDPGILDFTFGNPHDMPMPEYVDALRDAITPQNKDWFAYKDYVPAAQEAAAASLERLLRMPFAPEDILLTTGGFAAIATALKTAADPGDEVIYSLPPWFLYEGLAAEAGLTPVRVMIDLATFDLDVDAIAAAITPRTRVVIVNTPNNPTGRIYPPETLQRLATVLEEASVRNGRRIPDLRRAVQPDRLRRARFRSPAEFYPYTFIAYSYGKTHLAPGQRIGYIALPPTMPDREAVRAAVMQLQIVAGWAFPNAVMQYALPRLEQFTIDIDRLQRRRDRLVDALTAIGVRRPPAGGHVLPLGALADRR